MYLGDDGVLVAQMINFVEDLPSEWQQKFNHMRLNSGRATELGYDFSRSKLEKKFDERIHEQSLKPLLPVIQGLMRFRPSDRISASQALDLITLTARNFEEENDWMIAVEDGAESLHGRTIESDFARGVRSGSNAQVLVN